jgi:multidrug efflux pump subunit AcrA (membrane-fusion protein)
MHANKPDFARPGIALRFQFALPIVIALAIPLAISCRSTVTEKSGNIILNAPVTGVVRRVLVNEGASVDKDAAIIEIGAAKEQPASQTANTNSDQARAARAAQNDLAAAEAEANRASAELRRIEPLVKRGLASQAELDKARAQAQDSQERLKLAREKVNNPDANRNQAPGVASTEEIVSVRVPAAGTVKAISVHAGQTVTIGQPLATLVSNT